MIVTSGTRPPPGGTRPPSRYRARRLQRWEPHKYPSKEAQDANLEVLVRWIRDYGTRRDTFSLAAHRALFDTFAGEKLELTNREAFTAIGDSAGAGKR